MQRGSAELKVCLITEFFYPDSTGSSPTLLSNLVRELSASHGVEFDVITSRSLYRENNIKLAKFEEWEGSHIVRVNTPPSNRMRGPARPLAGLIFAVAALRAMERRKKAFDVVLVTSNPPAAPYAADAFRRRYQIPYVYLIHDLYPDIAVGLGAIDHGSIPFRLARHYQRKWLQNASVVILTGRSVRDRVACEYGIADDRLAVIPLWADEEILKAGQTPRRFWNEHAKGRFMAMYFGTIGPLQNVGIVIDAAKILQDSYHDIVFAIIGTGEKAPEIEKRLREEQIRNVIFVPKVQSGNIADLLASADISLVTVAPGMDLLCTPIKFYNILASRRPVIATVTENSEIGQVISETGCGFVVDPYDAAGLADAVVQLASNKALAEQMGENGYKAACERFLLPKVAHQYYSVLQSVGNNCLICGQR